MGPLMGHLGALTIGQTVLGIVFCVSMRFLVVSYARRAIRRVGIAVSFDLRQMLYKSVPQAGPRVLCEDQCRRCDDPRDPGYIANS